MIRRRFALLLGGIVATGLVAIGLTACSSGSNGAASNFTVGIYVGGASPFTEQAELAKHLAESKGWNVVELDNTATDTTTFQKDVDTFIQKKVDVVVGIFASPGTDAAVKKFAAAKIPVISYDIAYSGWYFVGVDNVNAGKLAGSSLAEEAKKEWDCQVDLVIVGHQSSVGIVDQQRTGGAEDAFKAGCPNVPAANYANFDIGNGTTAEVTQAARNAIAAHPGAKHIAALGLTDGVVAAILQSVKQIAPGAHAIGWGQGASDPSVFAESGFKGSVAYFFDDYPALAFAKIIDKLASGDAPKASEKDTPSTGYLVRVCSMTVSQASSLPPIAKRITEVEKSGKTAYELYCSTK